MTLPRGAELAVLGALAAARAAAPRAGLVARLRAAGVDDGEAVVAELVTRRWVRMTAGDVALVDLTAAGAGALLDGWSAIEGALQVNPPARDAETCPSLPWLTAVETEWIEALSINYRVAPERLAAVLPAPLEPELFKRHAWVQVLVSSLREMRPRGLPAPAGVCFYQVSYRAAARYRGADGTWRRGGYFVRSETNDACMRAIGNRLAEFRFHDFGAAEIVMLRDGELLHLGVDAVEPGGRLVAVVDTRPLPGPPASSLWSSLAELQEPLVDCYDAFGVDRQGGWLYTLSIERGPWRAEFVAPRDLFCEAFAPGGAWGEEAELDSVLHIPRCPYRWLPLQRQPLAGDASRRG
jgi:uncharacterized protein YqjF (DUF2071 family)